MSFRRRTYPEVLENLITSITGGVAGEEHPFPPPDGTRHELEQPPVTAVISVYGSRDGQPHQFRKDTDYVLTDQRALVWREGAELPDAGTLIQVNYYPQAAPPQLTDVAVGSVLRTIAEAFSMEMARLYAVLETVYRSGFIDTATGSALDKVVALLGIERVTGGRPLGKVTFTRASGTAGAITIPAGTRVITADGDVEYATTDTVTMVSGQNKITVSARDVEQNEPLGADTLTLMAVPIAGILSVTNASPTVADAPSETDEQLRTRAKNFLHGSERATVGAIYNAVYRQGIQAEVTDNPQVTPGVVQVRVLTDGLLPEQQFRLEKAILDARPAGVYVELKTGTPPKAVHLAIQLTTVRDLPEQDIRAAHRAVRKKITDYFATLPVKEVGSVNKIVGMALNTPGIADMRVLNAFVDGDDKLNITRGTIDIADEHTILGELHIGDPNLPSLLNVVVQFPAQVDPPDETQIRTALQTALDQINSLNIDENTPEADREISYGKLAHLTPLPGKPGAALSEFTGVVPSLGNYTLVFTISQETGLSFILNAASSAPYVLTPFERLVLDSIALAPEAAP